ncbi:MAG: hypothetical protein ACJ735_02690 [Actinomycetes bacterium]
MSILFWTFAPLVALVLATGWAHWRTRPRPPVDAQDSITEYERFRAAIRSNARVIDLTEPAQPSPGQVSSR